MESILTLGVSVAAIAVAGFIGLALVAVANRMRPPHDGCPPCKDADLLAEIRSANEEAERARAEEKCSEAYNSGRSDGYAQGFLVGRAAALADVRSYVLDLELDQARS